MRLIILNAKLPKNRHKIQGGPSLKTLVIQNEMTLFQGPSNKKFPLFYTSL